MEAYFDHNATSIIDEETLSLVIQAYRESYANPSSVHTHGRKARASYLKAKDQIASTLQLSAKELFFTTSASEAINWILLQKPYKHIISSDLEHAAIYNCLKELEKRGVKITLIHPGSLGYVNRQMLEKALTPETDCIILGSCNSETGIIQDTAPLAALAAQHKIPFFVDAVGLLGKGPMFFDPQVTGYVFSAHKIHGPKGIALLTHRYPKELIPLTFGGHQEGGKKAGTENVPAAIGFAHAFNQLINNPDLFNTIKEKRDYFESQLKSRCDIAILGDHSLRNNNTSCIQFKGMSGETLLYLLDQKKIYASHGSACSSGALEPSRVLQNMGLSFREAKECLRFSFSKYTSYAELDYAIESISEIIKAFRAII